MTKRQRETLSELMQICNSLGGLLDGTATHHFKWVDRQRAHAKVSKVIYGVLCDHPDNEQRVDDLEEGKEALEALRELSQKLYPDKQGFE